MAQRELSLGHALASYQSLFESVDDPSAISRPVLRRVLLARLAQLKASGDPYLKPSKASEDAFKSKSITAPNDESITPSQEELEFVPKIVAKLDLDHVQAFFLLRTFLESDEAAALVLPSSNDKVPASKSSSDQLLDLFSTFYFRERLAIVRLVGALLRIFIDPSHDCSEVAQAIVPLLLDLPDTSPPPTSSANSPSFVETLFRQFIGHARAPVPRSFSTHEADSIFWAKHSLRLQLSLLEVVFLAFYIPAPVPAPTMEAILVASHASGYGAAQANARLLGDDESTLLLSRISGLLVVISVELLDLEALLSHPDPSPSTTAHILSSSALLSSPSSLLSIHSFMITLSASPSKHTSPILIAWSYLLSRLTEFLGLSTPELYIPLADVLLAQGATPIYQSVAMGALGGPGADFFGGLREIMQSPLCIDVPSKGIAGSVDPNALGHRSVIRGLLAALTELVQVQLLPFDPLVEAYVQLYGSGSASLCHEFWEKERSGTMRGNSVLELASSRFPIYFRPLLRLSRALCGDESITLSSSSSSTEDDLPTDACSPESLECASSVLQALDSLTSLCWVLPSSHSTSAPSGPAFIYEPGPNPGEMQYRTRRALAFPGGASVAAGSVGRVVSPPRATPVVVEWNVVYSGWKLALEVLRSAVGIRSSKAVMQPSSSPSSEDVFGGRSAAPVVVSLEEMGMEGATGDEAVLDVLDLLRSVLAAGPQLATALVERISPPSDSADQNQESDLMQVLFTLLERTISGQQPSSAFTPRIVTSTLAILVALLPAYPGRIWTFIRSSSLLASTSRRAAAVSSILAAERVSGSYIMTLGVLDLVVGLFLEAQRSHFVVSPEFVKLKSDVVGRALSLVLAEIWTGFIGWKYNDLRERLDIGRKIASLAFEILRDTTLAPSTSGSTPSPLSNLQSLLADVFILNSSNLALAPITSTLVLGRSLVSDLYSSERLRDVAAAQDLTRSTLLLARRLLTLKRSLALDRIVPLEQLFFDRVPGQHASSSARSSSKQPKTDVVDAVARIATGSFSSSSVAREAVLLLGTLSGSLAAASSSPPSIVGHLEDPLATTRAFLAVLADPCQDRELRRLVWNLVSGLMTTQLGWASLFMDMSTSEPGRSSLAASSAAAKGKGREGEEKPDEPTALSIARTMVAGWETLWQTDPALLAAAVRLIDLAWQTIPHHPQLAALKAEPAFWELVVALVFKKNKTSVPLAPAAAGPSAEEDIGSGPEPDDEYLDNRAKSYRNLARAHAIQLLALDLSTTGRRSSSRSIAARSPRPASFSLVEKLFLPSHSRRLSGATLRYLNCVSDPELHDEIHSHVESTYPGFVLNRARIELPLEERDFGNDYLFSIDVVRRKIEGFRAQDVDDEVFEGSIQKVEALNLHWSWVDSQIACTRAWRHFLDASMPLILDGSASRAQLLMRDVRTILPEIAEERRGGDIILAVHCERLEILRALVEGAWGTSVMESDALAKSAGGTQTSPQLDSFIGSLPYVADLVASETFPPLDSLRGAFVRPFHRTLLQILFVFVRKAVAIAPPSATNTVPPQQRAIVHTFLQTSLAFLIQALVSVLERILRSQDPALEEDLQLLVLVFEQAVRPEHHFSPSEWLSQVDELGLVRLSMGVVASSTWISSASDVPSNSMDDEDIPASARPSRRLAFLESVVDLHVALSTLPQGSERLVAAGVMAAYSSSVLAREAEVGGISALWRDETGVSGGHDPGHSAWLATLAVVANLIGSVGSRAAFAFVSTEVVPWVQLCGMQLTKCLDWRAGTPIHSAQLQELDSTSTLFLAIASSLQSDRGPTSAPSPVVRVFASKALLVLQRINDLVAHPNHLFALIDPITDGEKVAIHRESLAMEKEASKPRIGTSPLAATSSGDSDALPDPATRPFICSVLQKLVILARTITFTLNLSTRALKTLTSELDSTSAQDLIVNPDSKVSPSEPATIGTLCELASASIDIHRQLASMRTSFPLSTASSSDPYACTSVTYLPAFSSNVTLSATRHLVEALALLCTTQLGLASSAAHQQHLALSSASSSAFSPSFDPLDRSTSSFRPSASAGRRRAGRPSNPTGAVNAVELALERYRELGQDVQAFLSKLQGGADAESARFLDVVALALEREVLAEP